MIHASPTFNTARRSLSKSAIRKPSGNVEVKGDERHCKESLFTPRMLVQPVELCIRHKETKHHPNVFCDRVLVYTAFALVIVIIIVIISDPEDLYVGHHSSMFAQVSSIERIST
jgi:hypothetical protein